MVDLNENEKASLAIAVKAHISFLEHQIDISESDDVDRDIAEIEVLQEVAEKLELDITDGDEPEEEPDPGEMDGDARTALVSAGMGTDEDYGG